MSSPIELNLFCPQCGYNLHGLPDGRCPECGREFQSEQLRGELIRMSLSTGKLMLRILLVPAIYAIAGAIIPLVANSANEKAMSILGIGGSLVLIGLFIPAIRISRRLAKHLAIMRALRLGSQQSGLKDRGFIRVCTFGLFCCQGILATGGFFGGCLVSTLTTVSNW